MLETQKYLLSHSLDELNRDYLINITPHPTLPLVILNYSQLGSSRVEKIARECRNLILEKDTWKLVARSFFRFFNLHEFPEEHRQFNWDSFHVTAKADGSLINVFNYKGEWLVTTRGSWADGDVDMTGKTWKELIYAAFPPSRFDRLNPLYSYTFELCSPYNHIVTKYDDIRLYLLSMFCGEEELKHVHTQQYFQYEIAPMSHIVNVFRPQTYIFSSIEHVQQELDRISAKDVTFEGFVLRDDNNYRIKLKSPNWVVLHHLRGEGNLFNPKYLIPLALENKREELDDVFPECIEIYEEVRLTLEEEQAKLLMVWDKWQDAPSQKEFALGILAETKFPGILFQARKTGVSPEDIWLQSADLIYNILYKNKR